MRKLLAIPMVLLMTLFAAGCNNSEDVVPDVPTNLEATNYISNTASNVILDWDPVPGAHTYNIYRSTSSGLFTSKTQIVSLLTASAFMDSNVTVGTTYYYQVTAVNADGESGPSAEVSITPG
jgi:fibronectin type 3 domain-containing protein